MIAVHVKLFANLRQYRPGLCIGESFAVELAEGATVADLVGELGLPRDQVKIVFVDGLIRGLDQALAEGNELGIFPPVGGG